MSRIQTSINKFFGSIAIFLFGGGFIALLIGWVFEQISISQLPSAQQTAEVIERDFDGAVCLMCFFLSFATAFYAFSFGFLMMFFWLLLSLMAKIRGNV